MSIIGFLGAGAMGQIMMSNLLEAGYDINVWNRTASHCHSVVQEGAKLCQTPREVAQGSDIVIAMLADDDASRAVWLDDNTGAINGLKKNTIAIECSTLSYVWCLELAESIRKTGATYVDAPVIGSRPQAQACQLIHFIGGDKAALQSIDEVLKVNAVSIYHLGKNGNGSLMKLAINGLLSVQLSSLVEMLGMLNKMGFTNETTLGLFNELPLSNPVLKGLSLQILADNFAPLFPIDLLVKDLSYLQQAAESVHYAIPGINESNRQYKMAQHSGYGHENISAVVKVINHQVNQ